MFCGLCEDACPVDALELTQDFELASYTREGADLGPADARGRAPAQALQVLIEPDGGGSGPTLTLAGTRVTSSFTSSLCSRCSARILTITRRSAVHSAISLIVSLVGVAGLFLLQKAEFLFAVQIVLYVGGIMVLFLFVIMLVNLDEAAKLAAVQPAVDGWRWLRWRPPARRVLLLPAQGRPRHSGWPLPGCRRRVDRRQRRSALAEVLFSKNTCCRSKSPRCCCWWPSWVASSWRRRGFEHAPSHHYRTLPGPERRAAAHRHARRARRAATSSSF